jgi:hypothetical protein
LLLWRRRGQLFEAMLADASVTHARTAGGAQLDSVQRLHAGDPASLSGITLEDGTAFAARVFVDGSYEGDLMARSGSSFTWGREANGTFNESYAGRREPFGPMDWAPVSPYEPDGTLLRGDGAATDALAAPLGAGDAMVQDYNFRLCVTKNASNMAPFPKPAAYNRSEWALLFKLAATVPRGAQLSEYLNSFQPLHAGKFDMNNGGLISTDCAGCSWRYPNSSYAERRAIVARHVAYQQGYMWTLANDAAIPAPVRAALREYGLCADEFTENGNWPEQLYVREARRLVGDAVYTQNDVLAMRAYSATNESAGMGSYNFDGHYSHRGPCLPNAARDGCTMVTAASPPMTAAQRANSSLVWTGGEGYGAKLTATYELPYSALLPQRAQTSNLLCPLTPSVTHVALATVRMEPQFMILGQTAGTAAALVAQQRAQQQQRAAVHDVDRAALAGALLAAGQILSAAQFPPRPPPSHGYACGAGRCFGTVTGSTLAPTYANDSTCAAACVPLAAGEWLALKAHWRVDGASSMTAVESTYLKKSEEPASGLPAELKKAVPIKTQLQLAKAAATADGAYWLATLAAAGDGKRE